MMRHRFRPSFRERSRSERGAELVEFALAVPVLIVILFAIAEFGILFQRYQVVTNAAREGARLAALAAAGYTTTDVENRVNAYLTAGGVPGTATTVVADDSFTASGGLVVPLKRVTVTYTYPMGVFSRVVTLIGGSAGPLTLRGVSTMRVEGT